MKTSKLLATTLLLAACAAAHASKDDNNGNHYGQIKNGESGDISIVSVPEPETLALFATGLVGVVIGLRRRRKP
jgi:hypothetical protein